MGRAMLGSDARRFGASLCHRRADSLTLLFLENFLVYLLRIQVFRLLAALGILRREI
jgi:hypothetical protein